MPQHIAFIQMKRVSLMRLIYIILLPRVNFIKIFIYSQFLGRGLSWTQQSVTATISVVSRRSTRRPGTIRIEKYWIKFLSEGDTLDVSKIDFHSNYIIITIMILTIFLPFSQ